MNKTLLKLSIIKTLKLFIAIYLLFVVILLMIFFIKHTTQKYKNKREHGVDLTTFQGKTTTENPYICSSWDGDTYPCSENQARSEDGILYPYIMIFIGSIMVSFVMSYGLLFTPPFYIISLLVFIAFILLFYKKTTVTTKL